MINKSVFLRFSFAAVIFSAMQNVTIAQEGTVPDQTNGTAELNINDLPLRSVNVPALTDVGGSIYMTNDFIPATIRLKNGGVVRNIPVKFNIYNNAIVVKKDGSEQKIEPFEEVTYYVSGSNGIAKAVIFREGYPDIENHGPNSVYEVLVDGSKLQLIKYHSQKVEDAPTLGDYSRRELVKSQQLYLYIPGGEIKKVSMGKKAISSSFPAFATQADEIVKAKSLNLKSESDLIQLVEELNK